MSSQELSTAIAEKIAELHQQAEAFASAARNDMENALSTAVECGQYIHEAEGLHRGQLLAWLRDNVQGLTPQRAKAYLSLFKTDQARREKGLAIDYRQMHLLGIIDDPKHDEAGDDGEQGKSKAGNCDQWARWTANLRGWFAEQERARPVDQWSDERKASVAAELKPLVDLYARLQG